MTLEADGRIHGLRKPKDGTAVPLGLVPIIGGGIVMIAFMTENAAENWSALHIEKTLGGSPEEGALGPAALALTMGFARLGGQWLAGRVNPFTLLRTGAVIAAIGSLIASQASAPMGAYAGFIIMGIGASVLAPTAFSLVGQRSAPEARARAVARATQLGYLGYFLGPAASGADRGCLRPALCLCLCGGCPVRAVRSGAASGPSAHLNLQETRAVLRGRQHVGQLARVLRDLREGHAAGGGEILHVQR